MLTHKKACIAYATMLNTLDSSELEELLDDNFCFTSQMVLADIDNKQDFVKYIKKKLQTIKSTNAIVYAELAKYRGQDCLLIAQNTKENLMGTILVTVENDKLKTACICIVPTPDSVKRSGIYPS